MVGTSVVYSLVVYTLSLPIYSVSVLIVLVHTVICYWFTVEWARIEGITVDLPSDITVLSQAYTLHAIKIGAANRDENIIHIKAANWYYESGSASTELCSIQNHAYSCSIGDGTAVSKGNGRWEYTLTITWNGENITSGVLSNNGDHVYRFYLVFSENITRNHYITIEGKYCTQ